MIWQVVKARGSINQTVPKSESYHLTERGLNSAAIESHSFHLDVSLRGADGSTKTVKTQNLLRGHHAFQLVDIGAAHDREQVQMRRTHGFKRDTERVVDVKVGKFPRIDKLFEPAASTVVAPRVLQHAQADHSND